MADYYKLNTQVVEVTTGVVVTGLIFDFQLEEDFAQKVGYGSEVITVEREVIEVAGTTTVTTLFETFDKGAPEIQLSHREEYWGDRVLDACGTIELHEQGSIDDSAYARFAFKVSFDSVDLTQAWEDSDLYFTAIVNTAEKPRGFEDFSLSIKPEAFAVAGVALVQPGDKLDPNLPVVLEVNVDFEENYRAHKMRSGTDVECAVSLDNVGFFRKKGEEDPRILESFNDDIERLAFNAELYGSNIYTDYSTSDQGEIKVNPGVITQDLILTKSEGGQSGDYLSVKGRMELTEKIREFHEDEQTVALVIKTVLPHSLEGYGALSFYIRSDLLTEGSLELSHEASERYYGYTFGVSSFWTRVRIPFDHLLGEEDSLEKIGVYSEHMMLSLYFELPAQRAERAVSRNEGLLEFELALDDFLLEE